MTRLKTEEPKPDVLRTELHAVLKEGATVSQQLAGHMTELQDLLGAEPQPDERAKVRDLLLKVADHAERFREALHSAARALAPDTFARLDEELDRRQAAMEAAHTHSSGD